MKKDRLYQLLTKQVANQETAPIKAEILSLKEQLASTDYKVIKCAEYSLAKLDPPYNIEELHAERQELRDKINALENKIASME